MRVVIAGGHGQIAQVLLRKLADDGHEGVGLVRNPDHVADLEALGAEAVVCDLEKEDPSGAVRGADAVVFAAGAGPNSGPERKRTVDLGGAVKLLEAAKGAGVRRYVIVSSMGADSSAEDDGGFGSYLRAKGEADDAVAASDLDWTIVRPGHLTDDEGTGMVQVGGSLDSGSVPRPDVVAVIAAALENGSAIGARFDLLAGETPVDDALLGLS